MNIETENDKSLDKYSYRNQSNLTGSVIYYNFNGYLREGYIYSNGKITQNITTPTASDLVELKKIKKIQNLNNNSRADFKSNKLSSTNSSTNSQSSCDWYLVDYYWMECTGWPNPCTYEYQRSEYIHFCPGTGNEVAISVLPPELGGSGGYAIIIDCNGVEGGTASKDNECNTCIGGDTGYTSCADYKNQIQDQCLKDLVNELIAAGFETEMGGIISYLDQNAELNVIFIEASTNTPSLAAAFPSLYYPTSNGIKFETYISLSPELAKNFSKEYVASIILHEILHAYFNSGGPHPNPLLNKQQQHDWMRTYYIEMFTDFLANNYGIPKTEAAGLAISHLGMWSESGTHTIDNIEYLVSDLMGLATQHMRESVAADNPGALGSPLCN